MDRMPLEEQIQALLRKACIEMVSQVNFNKLAKRIKISPKHAKELMKDKEWGIMTSVIIGDALGIKFAIVLNKEKPLVEINIIRKNTDSCINITEKKIITVTEEDIKEVTERMAKASPFTEKETEEKDKNSWEAITDYENDHDLKKLAKIIVQKTKKMNKRKAEIFIEEFLFHFSPP